MERRERREGRGEREEERGRPPDIGTLPLKQFLDKALVKTTQCDG